MKTFFHVLTFALLMALLTSSARGKSPADPPPVLKAVAYTDYEVPDPPPLERRVDDLERRMELLERKAVPVVSVPGPTYASTLPTYTTPDRSYAAPGVAVGVPFVRSSGAVYSTTPATTVLRAGTPPTPLTSSPVVVRGARTRTPVLGAGLFGTTSGCSSGRCNLR